MSADDSLAEELFGDSAGTIGTDSDPARGTLAGSSTATTEFTSSGEPAKVVPADVKGSPLGSGGDNDDEMEDAEVADDLFGDDEVEGAADPADVDTEKEEEDEDADEELDDGLTAEERRRRKELEYEEEDHEVVLQEQIISELNQANLPIPRDTNDRTWNARLPNFLHINSQPFDEGTWEPKSEEDNSTLDGKLVADENYIRWRWVTGPDGQMKKQSNSRIVRWEDGSMSLQIGSELFDITANVDQTALGGSENPSNPNVKPNASLNSESQISGQQRSHGLTYMVCGIPGTHLFESQAAITGQMNFRPISTTSEAHKRLVGSIAGRNVKTAKTLPTVTQVDPEQEKARKEHAENVAAKKARREAEKKKGIKKTPALRRKSVRSRALDDFSDDDDDHVVGAGEYDDSEEADEDGDGFGGYGRGSRSARRQATAAAGTGAYEEDDFVVADVDENEDEVARPTSRSRRDEAAEPDEIDDLDAMVERAHRERKEKRTSDVLADDVPSSSIPGKSEESLPLAVKRRRVIASDDEEE